MTANNILRSRNFQISFWSFFFLWISFDFFILFPLFILRRGGDTVDVGIQEAIFFLPSVLIRPVAGWFTDHIGRLKTLWTGSALMIVTAFSFLLLHGNYDQIKWYVALILFLRGTSFAAFYTGFFTFAADLSRAENRLRVIGMFGISGLVGHGLAPWIGQKTLDQFDFFGFFLISGLLSLLSLIISAFLKEERAIQRTGHTGIAIVKMVTFSRRNVIIIPAAFVFGYAIASFNTFGAPYFEFWPGAKVGNFFLTYGLTAGLIRLLLVNVADKFPRWLLVLVFFTVQAIGVSLIVIHPVERFYLVSAACCGIAHGVLFPTLTAMAIDAHPQEFRGMVTSVFTAVMDLGFSFGSYIQGVIIKFTSYPFMFLSTAVLGGFFSVYLLFVRFLQKNK